MTVRQNGDFCRQLGERVDIDIGGFRRVMTDSFITGAGQTIVVVVAILNFFNSLGTDGEFGHHDSDTSILSQTDLCLNQCFTEFMLHLLEKI